MSIQTWLEKRWWRKKPSISTIALTPLSGVFAIGRTLRLLPYAWKIRKPISPGRPVIAVGNVVVGGGGKTPVVQAIVRCLKNAGYNPGVISRGYPISPETPVLVTKNSSPSAVGDEPILHARMDVPVVICSDRVAAGQYLLECAPAVDILVADDALQHYRLHRDIEVEVVSDERGYGNGFSLPAGPLREPISRARKCYLRIKSSWHPPMKGYKDGEHHVAVRKLDRAYALLNPDRVVALQTFASQAVHLVAGIANPRQFAAILKRKGVEGKMIDFPDHHPFSAKDFSSLDKRPILMTEKDAVKCRRFADDRMWVIPMRVSLRPETKIKLLRKVASVTGRNLEGMNPDELNTALYRPTQGAKPS